MTARKACFTGHELGKLFITLPRLSSVSPSFAFASRTLGTKFQILALV